MKNLDELDSVDWKSLKHAYGQAADVPKLIRDLTSKHKKRRDAAFHQLYSNLWHQGSVYSATPYAVPFLIGLLQTSGLPEPARVLAYLAALATGSSFLAVHQNCSLPYFEERRSTEAFQEELKQELDWATRTRQAVATGLPFYTAFMDTDELSTQTNAFFLIGELVDDAGRQLLIQRLMSDDSLHTDVIATAIFSLRRCQVCPAELILRFREHESQIIRYGIAMLCAQFAPKLVTIDLIRNLIDFMTDYLLSYEKYKHLPFSWKIPFDSYAKLILADFDPTLYRDATDYLITRLPYANCDSYEDALHALLAMAFSTELVRTHSLSTQQYAVLMAIGSHELTWDEDGVCRFNAFEEFRIPSKRGDFLKLLGISEFPR